MRPPKSVRIAHQALEAHPHLVEAKKAIGNLVTKVVHCGQAATAEEITEHNERTAAWYRQAREAIGEEAALSITPVTLTLEGKPVLSPEKRREHLEAHTKY